MGSIQRERRQLAHSWKVKNRCLPTYCRLSSKYQYIFCFYVNVGKAKFGYSLYKRLNCLFQTLIGDFSFWREVRIVLSMNGSDILYEIQTQIASCSSPIEIGEYWHFHDVFVQNLENRLFSPSSIIAMNIALVKKLSHNERFLYIPASYKLEDSLISFYGELRTERDISSYLQAMFELLREYSQVFWFPLPMVHRVLTFFSTILPWIRQQCSSDDLKTVHFTLVFLFVELPVCFCRSSPSNSTCRNFFRKAGFHS